MQQACIIEAAHDRHESVKSRVGLGYSLHSRIIQRWQSHFHDMRKSVQCLPPRSLHAVAATHSRAVALISWCMSIWKSSKFARLSSNFAGSCACAAHGGTGDEQSNTPDRSAVRIATSRRDKHRSLTLPANSCELLTQCLTGHPAA